MANEIREVKEFTSCREPVIREIASRYERPLMGIQRSSLANDRMLLRVIEYVYLFTNRLPESKQVFIGMVKTP